MAERVKAGLSLLISLPTSTAAGLSNNTRELDLELEIKISPVSETQSQGSTAMERDKNLYPCGVSSYGMPPDMDKMFESNCRPVAVITVPFTRP